MTSISVLAAAFVAVVGFVVAYMKRGQKLKDYRRIEQAEKELDHAINAMSTTLPSTWHIDRVLAEHAADKRSAGAGSNQGGVQ